MDPIDVNKTASEWYPEKSATFENDGEVNKILAYLKDHKLITEFTALARDGSPYLAIATTETGADIADTYFTPHARRREIEKIKRDLNNNIPDTNEENAALKNVARSLIDVYTSMATQQLLTELSILEKLIKYQKD